MSSGIDGFPWPSSTDSVIRCSSWRGPRPSALSCAPCRRSGLPHSLRGRIPCCAVSHCSHVMTQPRPLSRAEGSPLGSRFCVDSVPPPDAGSSSLFPGMSLPLVVLGGRKLDERGPRRAS